MDGYYGRKRAQIGSIIGATTRLYKFSYRDARALYETKATLADRTRLIQWSADYEHIAEWVGDDWGASDPPPDPDVTGFLQGWSDVGRM